MEGRRLKQAEEPRGARTWSGTCRPGASCSLAPTWHWVTPFPQWAQYRPLSLHPKCADKSGDPGLARLHSQMHKNYRRWGGGGEGGRDRFSAVAMGGQGPKGSGPAENLRAHTEGRGICMQGPSQVSRIPGGSTWLSCMASSPFPATGPLVC